MDSDSSFDDSEGSHLRAEADPSELPDRLPSKDGIECTVSTQSSVASSHPHLPPTEESEEMSPQCDDEELSSECEEGTRSDTSSRSAGKVIQQSESTDISAEKRVDEEETDVEYMTKRDDTPGHCEDMTDTESNDGLESLDTISGDGSERKAVANIANRKCIETEDEIEQLDFEAEDQQEKEDNEEGECDVKVKRTVEMRKSKKDELEEGELSDDDEPTPEEPETRKVCRFYIRGQCTWGSNCRFMHPGVTDKGRYSMFDMPRPLVPVTGTPTFPIVDYRTCDKPTGLPGPEKEEPPVILSAWERGLRQAKEMMRMSSIRKETDIDFEVKKMNLSLGEGELEKENVYYTRPASPVYNDVDRWNLNIEVQRRRDEIVAVECCDDVSEFTNYHHSRGSGSWRHTDEEPTNPRAIRVEVDHRCRGRERSDSKYHAQHQRRPIPQDVYDKHEKTSSRPKSRPIREVCQRVKKRWRDVKYAESNQPSSRGDEWADPWMRSKSPHGRKSANGTSSQQSYSSGSPHSSSSRSSSSQSSHSSSSRDSRSTSESNSPSVSRSVSRSSSRTPSSYTHKRTSNCFVSIARAANTNSPSAHTPLLRKVSKQQKEPRGFNKTNPLTSNLTQTEKKGTSERASAMNLPAPNPRKQREVRPPSPGRKRKSAQNPPASPPRPPPSVASSASRRSKSSRSSSSSDSTDSSSDSSESSCSSSSSSNEPSPKKCPPKNSVLDECVRRAIAQSLKVKAMDALKLSGQKQQIKLTLKAPTVNATQNKPRTFTGLPELPELNIVRRDRMPVKSLIGKKRSADHLGSPAASVAAKRVALEMPPEQKVVSRREELLKQLKAVEDAIARKRSKK